MSVSQASGSLQDPGGAGEGAANVQDLPDRPNPVVEEKKGKAGNCTLRYYYIAEKGDQVSCQFEDETVPLQNLPATGESQQTDTRSTSQTAESPTPSQPSGFCIVFRVKRLHSNNVSWLHKSKVIPASLKSSLQVKSQDLKLEKQFYVVEMKKLTAFDLAEYFRPDSPPV